MATWKRWMVAAAALGLAQVPALALAPSVLRVGTVAGRREPKQAHLVAGEQFRFSIGYMGVLGARAKLSVAPRGENTRVLTADVENTALLMFIFRIRDRFQSITDLDGNTHSTHLWQNETGTQRYREETFLDDRVVAVEHHADGDRVRTQEVTARPLDPLASLFWLRAQELATGDVVQMELFVNNRVFESRNEVLGRVRLGAAGKVYDAIHVRTSFFREGKRVEDVHAEFWLSDDDRRLPLRVVAATTYGNIVGSLEQ